MPLLKLTYVEHDGQPNRWELKPCDFGPINLVVGRNATGKTRLLSVIDSLCKKLAGENLLQFISGTFEAEIELSGKRYSLHLEYADTKIVKESLVVDGDERLIRDASGKGKIWYEKEGKYIDFEMAPSVLALQQRQDALQHPFVLELSKWAAGSRIYHFGSPFGKDLAIPFTQLEVMAAAPGSDLISTYIKAWQAYRGPYDEAILNDMRQLGYDLVAVKADDVRKVSSAIKLPGSEPFICLSVVERERAAPLSQFEMSQGMFRALALVIHLNASRFSKRRTLMMVDDIGEGLDFERSAALIELLIHHAKEQNVQLILTSNDRFVMNKVPLEHWVLLRRQNSVIRAHTERNSPKEFAEFKYMGLSNFDFFTSAAFS